MAKFLKGRSTKYILVFKGGWDGIRSSTEETHIVQRGTCSCHRPTTLRENNLFYLKNWSFNSAPLFNHSVTSKINPSRLNSTIKSSYLVSDHIFYSRNLNAWFRGDIVRRNLMLVTLTGQRVNRHSLGWTYTYFVRSRLERVIGWGGEVLYPDLPRPSSYSQTVGSGFEVTVG